MNKYHKYKDSGIQWIGKIPEHWETVRLKYLGESIIGIIYSPSDVTTKENGTLVLRSSNIQNGKLAFKDCVYVSKDINEKHLTKEGDILLCARNGSAHLVGKSAYIPKELEGVSFGAFMSIVRTDIGKFLFYFFNSQIFKAQTGLFSTSTINQLTADTLNNMRISIPTSEEEQTQIAHYLDKKTKEIDELIAAKKKLLQLYEEEKTAIINQAVTKGINPDVPMKDSGIEWLGEIPAHWEVKKLKYIADIILGKMLTSENKGGYFLKPYLRAANLGWLTVNIEDVKNMWFSEKEIKKYRVEKNDLLVSEGGEVGRTCIWKEELTECYIQNSVHRVVLNNNCISKYFLHAFYLYGQKGVFDFLVNRISIAHLTVEKLKDVQFSVPPKVEQNQIVKYIETEITEIDTKKERTKNLINLLSEYRTTLISEVVTGKINVLE